MWNRQHIIFIWRRSYWQILKSALVYLETQSKSQIHKKTNSSCEKAITDRLTFWNGFVVNCRQYTSDSYYHRHCQTLTYRLYKQQPWLIDYRLASSSFIENHAQSLWYTCTINYSNVQYFEIIVLRWGYEEKRDSQCQLELLTMTEGEFNWSYKQWRRGHSNQKLNNRIRN